MSDKKSSVEIALVAVGLLITASASYFSWQASDEATKVSARLAVLEGDLNQRKFGVDIFQASLPFFEKFNTDDPTGRYCNIIIQLARVEEEETKRTRIATLWHSITRRKADIVAANSASELSLAQCEVAGEDVTAQVRDETIIAPDGAESGSIGKWHAVLASFQPQSCKLAKKVAAAAEDSLGMRVAIYRTTISNHYAVVADAGDSFDTAKRYVAKAKAAGQAAVERVALAQAPATLDATIVRYWTDAFVQENRGWYVDPDCRI